jgi:GGDEF domain-containing protein
VFVPGANLAAARLYAEAVRIAFAAQGPWLRVDRLSASFGVVQLEEDEPLSGAMRRADQALYEAKRAGRDRVNVFGDDAVGERRFGGNWG